MVTMRTIIVCFSTHGFITAVLPFLFISFQECFFLQRQLTVIALSSVVYPMTIKHHECLKLTFVNLLSAFEARKCTRIEFLSSFRSSQVLGYITPLKNLMQSTREQSFGRSCKSLYFSSALLPSLARIFCVRNLVMET